MSFLYAAPFAPSVPSDYPEPAPVVTLYMAQTEPFPPPGWTGATTTFTINTATPDLRVVDESDLFAELTRRAMVGGLSAMAVHIIIALALELDPDEEASP